MARRVGKHLGQVFVTGRIDGLLIGIRLYERKDVQVVHLGLGNQHGLAMRIKKARLHKLVEVAKHGTVVHVVAIEQVVVVGEIGAVGRRQVDGTREARVFVHVVRGIVEVVSALHDGVVDIGVIDRNPCAIVAVQGSKLAGRELRIWVIDDVGTVLHGFPARLGRLLDVERVVNRETAAQHQRCGKKHTHQGHDPVGGKRKSANHLCQELRFQRGPPAYRLTLRHMATAVPTISSFDTGPK